MTDSSPANPIDHSANLVFKPLDLAGVNTLVGWAAAEGWNPGFSDAELFYAADPDGFVGCFIDDQFIAGGSVVSYADEFGFMGLFIVKPEFRGSGIGAKLWHFRKNLLLSRLKHRAAIGMDGVVAMQPFYNQGGFEIHFRDERYQRRGEVFETNTNVSSVNDADLHAILEYDLPCFGVDRKDFLVPWIKQPHGSALKYCLNQQLKGFAVIRKCQSGFKVGPLFADDEVVAEALYKQCLTIASGDLVFIDIPLINLRAVRLVKKFQAEYVFECARMYLGTPPQTAISKVFGITSFELG
jgi:GNAT superfamily N-acetyltransferase